MKKLVLYIVLAREVDKHRWVEVTRKPLPRPEVSRIVAAQWAKGRFAQAMPINK